MYKFRVQLWGLPRHTGKKTQGEKVFFKKNLSEFWQPACRKQKGLARQPFSKKWKQTKRWKRRGNQLRSIEDLRTTNSSSLIPGCRQANWVEFQQIHCEWETLATFFTQQAYGNNEQLSASKNKRSPRYSSELSGFVVRTAQRANSNLHGSKTRACLTFEKLSKSGVREPHLTVICNEMLLSGFEAWNSATSWNLWRALSQPAKPKAFDVKAALDHFHEDAKDRNLPRTSRGVRI